MRPEVAEQVLRDVVGDRREPRAELVELGVPAGTVVVYDFDVGYNVFARVLVKDVARQPPEQLALGIDTTLHPFVFTFDPASRKAHAEASVDGYLVYNGMSAWDPATRTFYGLVETSESVPAPMLFGFSAATGAASAPPAPPRPAAAPHSALHRVKPRVAVGGSSAIDYVRVCV